MKIDLLYRILVIITRGKTQKAHTITINLKYQPKYGTKGELPDGSYSASDIQDYFEYIFKKHGENIGNPSVKIYINKIENRIKFRNKNGYSLELLTTKTIKLLESTENKITEDKNTENVRK